MKNTGGRGGATVNHIFVKEIGSHQPPLRGLTRWEHRSRVPRHGNTDHESRTIVVIHFAVYSAISRFCANGHSLSTHWASQQNPVRAAISGISSAWYLCELSVQIVSPSPNMIRRLAARMCTVCRRVERKSISIRLSSAFHCPSYRNLPKSK